MLSLLKATFVTVYIAQIVIVICILILDDFDKNNITIIDRKTLLKYINPLVPYLYLFKLIRELK